MPAGLEFMLLRDTAAPEHIVQLGIVRVADMQAFRDTVLGGRDTMLKAIAPHVASVGIDAAYDMAEEVAPVHA